MGKREFFYRKLHSLLGVIPVGVFLIVHFTVNFFATRGPDAYNAAANFMGNLPLRYFLEVVVIFLPLLFHAIYGVYIALQAKQNVNTYGFFHNWMFLLQRVSGVILFLFVVWHVWGTRIQAALGAPVNFEMMANIVSNPLYLTLYVIGVVSATFHFANGLWGFFITWGITVTPQSQKVSAYVSGAFFVAITAFGLSALFAFV